MAKRGKYGVKIRSHFFLISRTNRDITLKFDTQIGIYQVHMLVKYGADPLRIDDFAANTVFQSWFKTV